MLDGELSIKKHSSKGLLNIEVSPAKQIETKIVIVPASSGAMPEAERESSESS